MTQNNAKGQNLSLNTNGDTSGSASAMTTIKIQNRNVLSGTPTSGQILTWIAANSRWEASASPTYLSATGPSVKNVAVVTTGSAYSISDTDVEYIGRRSAISHDQVNLPATSPVGQVLFFANSTSVNLTINAAGGTNIFGSSSVTITRNIILICYDGANWAILGSSL